MLEKKKRRVPLLVKILAIFLVVAIVVPTVVFNISHVPGSLLIRAAFSLEPRTPPDEFNFTDLVDTVIDISYGELEEEKLDLYTPKISVENCPLIIWVHGGAFVGGDKKDVKYFAKALANNGYAVAVINYSLSPENEYPTPVYQLGKVYEFLKYKNYVNSDKINIDNIFFAGESAGAHIASQFAILQTNVEYRESFLNRHNINLPDVIPSDVIKGLLLYCGPYSVDEIKSGTHPLFLFMVWQAVWAYFGDRNATNNLELVAEADIIANVTESFPPSFITDGNAVSFPEHGKKLSARLTELGVPVTDLFFDDFSERVIHMFQFDLSKEAGQKSFEYSLEFLNKFRD